MDELDIQLVPIYEEEGGRVWASWTLSTSGTSRIHPFGSMESYCYTAFVGDADLTDSNGAQSNGSQKYVN